MGSGAEMGGCSVQVLGYAGKFPDAQDDSATGFGGGVGRER